MSFLGLLFRSVGAWGAGLGRNLTAAEVDENFYLIDQWAQALDANPPQANSISNITQVGDNLYVYLQDATLFGPFPLPTASPIIISKTISDHTYFPILADRGKYIRCTADDSAGGTVVVIPSDAELLFPTDTEFYFRQVGQAITFEGSSAVTIHGVTGFLNQSGGQGAVVQIKKVGADEWDLFGLLETTP